MKPDPGEIPHERRQRLAKMALTATLATYAALKRAPVIPEPAALLVSAAVGVATYLLN